MQKILNWNQSQPGIIPCLSGIFCRGDWKKMFPPASSGKRWLYMNTSPGLVFSRPFSQLTQVKKYAIFISQVPCWNFPESGNFPSFGVSSLAGRGFLVLSALCPPVCCRHFVHTVVCVLLLLKLLLSQENRKFKYKMLVLIDQWNIWIAIT